jgi:chromate reductase
MGFKPRDAVFDPPEIGQQLEVIKRPDTILIDVGSRPYGESAWEGKPCGVVSCSPGAIGESNSGWTPR